MKLTKREKILIGIFLGCVIIYFTVTFVTNGRILKLQETKDEYINKQLALETIHKNITSIPENEVKLKELTTYVNSQNILSSIKQESIMVFLNKYFSSNKIKISATRYNEAVNGLSMNISSRKNDESTFESKINEIESFALVETKSSNNQNNKDTLANSNKQALSIRNIAVSIDFECSYDSMINFINQMQNYPYEITITNINFSIENNITIGSMDIIFYELLN